MTFESLQKHGLEFVSQEDKQLCVVFATEAGLAMFQEHLNKLGVVGQIVTYRQILEAIEGIDSWSAEDRKSWALRHIGLPDTDTFKLDIELWPHHVANHPIRIRLCAAFEAWLAEVEVTTIHRLNFDSLVMYRVEVNLAQAEMLLNHVDVRLVDLIPQTGISYPQLNRDIGELPRNIPSPAQDAARVCILDSGINTNHPLLRMAIGESQSFVQIRVSLTKPVMEPQWQALLFTETLRRVSKAIFGAQRYGYITARSCANASRPITLSTMSTL